MRGRRPLVPGSRDRPVLTQRRSQMRETAFQVSETRPRLSRDGDRFRWPFEPPLTEMLECRLHNSHGDVAMVEELVPKPCTADDDRKTEYFIHAGTIADTLK